MAELFELKEWVTWTTVKERPELIHAGLDELVRVYTRGPFKVVALELARKIPGFPPPHPQLLTISLYNLSIPRKFSGILLTKAS